MSPHYAPSAPYLSAPAAALLEQTFPSHDVLMQAPPLNNEDSHTAVPMHPYNALSPLRAASLPNQEKYALFNQTFSNWACISEHLSLPKPDLLTFSGNAKDYFKFITNFETNLASKVTDYKVKLGYLIQFCSGEPKRFI